MTISADGKRGRMMTNEEAKEFLDNLKICIEEHPIVADWLVEIADRKTESSDSEKPNNCNDCKWSMQNCHDIEVCCEDETGMCVGYEPKDEPQTDCSWK